MDALALSPQEQKVGKDLLRLQAEGRVDLPAELRSGPSKPMKYIMVGNPGVGKSSTINSFVGTVLFTAGPSMGGSGVTAFLDVKHWKNLVFMDTPGLNDVSKRTHSALAIEEALQEPGEYRLIFVILEVDGRVRPDDLTTIKLVTDALNSTEIQVKDDMYSILVNKVHSKWLQKLRVIEGQEQAWIQFVNDALMARGSPGTKHIQFGRKLAELELEIDAVVDLPEDTLAFLTTGPTIIIDGCGTIDADSFEEQATKAVLAVEQAEYQRQLTVAAVAERDESRRAELKERHEKGRAVIAKQASDARADASDARASAADNKRKEAVVQQGVAQAAKVQAQSDKKAAEDAKTAAEKVLQAAKNAKSAAEEGTRRATAARAAAEAERDSLLSNCTGCGNLTSAPTVLGIRLCSKCRLF